MYFTYVDDKEEEGEKVEEEEEEGEKEEEEEEEKEVNRDCDLKGKVINKK